MIHSGLEPLIWNQACRWLGHNVFLSSLAKIVTKFITYLSYSAHDPFTEHILVHMHLQYHVIPWFLHSFVVFFFYFQAVYELTGERPTHHSHPCGTEFDSITRHEGDLTVSYSY